MKPVRTTFRIAGLILAATALAGGAAPPNKGSPPEAQHEVWKSWRWLFKHPVSYSRRLAKVPKGTRVAILSRGKGTALARWNQVSLELAEGEKKVPQTGWMLLAPRKLHAGEAAKHLGGKASPSGIALALKGIVEAMEAYLKALPATSPAADQTFQAVQNVWLDPSAVDTFAQTAGLKRPAREKP